MTATDPRTERLLSDLADAAAARGDHALAACLGAVLIAAAEGRLAELSGELFRAGWGAGPVRRPEGRPCGGP